MGEALQDDHLPVGAEPPLHLLKPGVMRRQEAVIISNGQCFPRLQAGLLLQWLGQGRHDEALPGMVGQPLLLGVRFRRGGLGHPALVHQVPPGPYRAVLDGRPPAPYRFNVQGVGGCRLLGRAGDAAGQQIHAGQGLALKGEVLARGISLKRTGNLGVDLLSHLSKGPGRGEIVLVGKILQQAHHPPGVIKDNGAIQLDVGGTKILWFVPAGLHLGQKFQGSVAGRQDLRVQLHLSLILLLEAQPLGRRGPVFGEKAPPEGHGNSPLSG